MGMTENLTIIEPSRDTMDDFGPMWGEDIVDLDQKHIDALLSGQVLATHDGEYTTFIKLTSTEIEKRKGEPKHVRK